MMGAGAVMPDSTVDQPVVTETPITTQQENLEKKSSIVEKVMPGKKEVFNISQNKYTYYDAEPLCRALGAEVATYEQVKDAFEKGADWCNYGWSKGQMAVYPTQESTWNKLQNGPEDQRNACGQIGVNGGYFDNPELQLTRFSVKPSHPRSATSFSTVQLAIRDGLISIPLGALIGSACAAFLWSLDTVTKVRIDHPFIIYFLPVAGIGLGWVYTHFGKSTAPGNNLVIHSIRSAQPVPRRMAPIIFLSTLATHLFGGSAGREGTAVQMGAGMASAACGLFKPSDVSRQTLLLSGVAAGFGGVFGTPFAGAVFCLEMIAHNRPSLWMFFPSAVAAFTSDYTCKLWGVVHTSYPVNLPMPDSSFGKFIGTDGLLISKILIAALTFGLVAKAFALAANESKKLF